MGMIRLPTLIQGPRALQTMASARITMKLLGPDTQNVDSPRHALNIHECIWRHASWSRGPWSSQQRATRPAKDRALHVFCCNGRGSMVDAKSEEVITTTVAGLEPTIPCALGPYLGHLATGPVCSKCPEICPATRNRTRDHLIADTFYSQMLYQLSYSWLIVPVYSQML